MESAHALLYGLSTDLQDHSALSGQNSGHVSKSEPSNLKARVHSKEDWGNQVFTET